MYLREPRLPIDAAVDAIQTQSNHSVEQLVKTRANINSTVRNYLEAANDYQVRYSNRHCREVTFQVGD